MGAVFSVNMNMSRTSKAFQNLRTRAPLAIARSLNRAAVTMKASMSRDIAADMSLKVTVVKDSIAIHEATGAKQVAQLVAPSSAAIARGGRVPLYEFGAKGPVPSRGKGRGVTYRLGGKSRNRNPNAFIATMRSGHIGVFQRNTTKRLPIHELFGPSIVKVFRKYHVSGLAVGQAALLKNLQSEFRFANRSAQ